jgi:hypothetical protein
VLAVDDCPAAPTPHRKGGQTDGFPLFQKVWGPPCLTHQSLI